jgi:hypothetical protein
MSWLFWWNVDQGEIDRQVEGYKTLGFFRSARKQSVLCLAFSMIVTTGLIHLSQTDPNLLVERFDAVDFIDVGAFGFLALFIYLGHRWAMIVAMVLWTLERGLPIADQASAPHPNGWIIVGSLTFWAGFMHAFYVSFKVEQQRRRIARLDNSRLAQVFD